MIEFNIVIELGHIETKGSICPVFLCDREKIKILNFCKKR